MPQRRASQEPPKVMTWSKALPVIITAGIFDLIRLFFEFFWFTGPALAGIYCAVKVTNVVGTGGIGTTIAGTVCSAAALALGAAASAGTIALGIVMSEAVGLIGFLVLGLWILMTNARIFKANAGGVIWFVGSLLVSEIPVVGSIPAFSIVLWKMYSTQIKVEKEAFQKFQTENTAALAQERNQQAAQMMQIRAAQQAQIEAQAANDAEYIPQDSKEAA